MFSLLTRLCDDTSLGADDRPDRGMLLLKQELNMLFSSRARMADVEMLSLVNASVVNYGIDESVIGIADTSLHKRVMAQRISTAIRRFEPRLTQVDVLAGTVIPTGVLFDIHACFQGRPVVLYIVWNGFSGTFSFHE